MNIVCTGKPGDGLLRYSYEHCCHLNYVGYECKLVIIPNPKFTKEDYIKAIKDQYQTYENVVFDSYTPTSTEITLVLGRSMITLPYLDKHKYTKDQLLTLRLLFSNKIIALYDEIGEYPLALEYFKPKKVYDLCDHEVYPNGVGKQYVKMFNFENYKWKKPKDGGPVPTQQIYYSNINILIGLIEKIELYANEKNIIS